MSTNNDTEPITHAELAAAMSAAMSAVASTFSVMVDMPRGVQPVTMTAEDCRHMASLIDSSLGPDSPAALILRRAADQIDPSTVPAEPDLTTRAGWEATMAALGDVEWEDMPIPSCREQRVGLLAAWKIADLSGHDKDAVLLAQVFTASLADEA